MQKRIKDLKIGDIFTFNNKKYKLQRVLGYYIGYYIGVLIKDHTIRIFNDEDIVLLEIELMPFMAINSGESFSVVDDKYGRVYTKTNSENYAIYDKYKLAWFNPERDMVYKVE